MDDTLLYLIEKIEDERKAIIESLGDGSAKDYASYQQAVGVVRGLLTAQSLITDLAKKMETFDE